jgi:transcription elongation GreA/GreB family factor
MSRAFVKETDDSEEIVPHRPISRHPNLVTAEGLALIERHLTTAVAEREAAQSAGDHSALARAARDVRYWTSRRGSAQIVSVPETTDKVRFGSIVTILRQDGRMQTFRIVGEDEADPARNLLSYVSPLARALMGNGASDVVRAGGADAEIKKIG